MYVCRAERGALGIFRGHARWFCLHIPRSCARREPLQWGEAGRGLGEPGTGAVIFRGRGRFRVPPVITDWSSLLHVVRSAVGVILTSPSLLVEGVRSGSRRRNAATASSLAGGMPGYVGGAQRRMGWRCTMWPVYRVMTRTCVGDRAEPGTSNGMLRTGHTAESSLSCLSRCRPRTLILTRQLPIVSIVTGCGCKSLSSR